VVDFIFIFIFARASAAQPTSFVSDDGVSPAKIL
jgi:hypothetical protein